MLNLPGGKVRTDIPVLGSRVPKPDEIALLPQPLLKAVMTIGEPLKNMQAKWGIGGDAGEVMKGVNIQHVDKLEIITTKDGCEEICEVLGQYVTLKPAPMERKVDREADIDGKMLPVFIRSHYAELMVDGAKVEVHGDEQIKVAEWDWGDPLDFEPDYAYVVGVKVPMVPLRLKSELALGLGWLDRVELISDAVIRSQHRH